MISLKESTKATHHITMCSAVGLLHKYPVFPYLVTV